LTVMIGMRVSAARLAPQAQWVRQAPRAQWVR
jgi:hypothetical protein